MATALEEEYGIPQIKGPQPYGIKGTDDWLRAVARTVGKNGQIEDYIKEQHEKWLPEIEKLKRYELIVDEQNRIKLTSRGIDLANQVMSEFM
jgi:nitrogenase molybdenum-iron protein alpha/beta subunit